MLPLVLSQSKDGIGVRVDSGNERDRHFCYAKKPVPERLLLADFLILWVINL